MRNDFLPLLWDYSDLPHQVQSKIDNFFEDKKYDSMCGDDYSAYAAYVIDLVCFRRKANISCKEMDIILDGCKYPKDFADRLTAELAELLDTPKY